MQKQRREFLEFSSNVPDFQCPIQCSDRSRQEKKPGIVAASQPIVITNEISLAAPSNSPHQLHFAQKLHGMKIAVRKIDSNDSIIYVTEGIYLDEKPQRYF